ncbi:MAG: hypothetical protein LQ352_000518 [Teloschistes flavicans]|nr:MAG: hypothetical protein LQ352_000518 [Teloschistes flavicans]
MNVEQIVQQAENFEYNPLIPFKHWSRSAGTLMKEAEIYEHEGNEQQTYLLLFRHARLVLEKLPSHPEARSRQNAAILQHLRRDVLSNFPKLETLKPHINKRYDRYQQFLESRRQAEVVKTQFSPSPPRGSAGTQHDPGHARLPSDPTIGNGLETLTAGENRDLAVKLAHKEIRRRATARKATRQAGISAEEEHERRTAGVWVDWEEALTRKDENIDQEALCRQMRNVRAQLNGSRVDSRHKDPQDPRPSNPDQDSYYRYPTIAPKHALDDTKERPLASDGSSVTLVESDNDPPPQRPPKDQDLTTDTCDLPGRPAREETSKVDSLDRSTTASPAKESLKPSTFTFNPSAYLENGTPLRTIFLPPSLRHQFLSIAMPNTRANLEMCGILCGTLISSALFISKLVIPEQESTSDTCEMLNESDFFDYVDGEDLMVLGWIHTHPTQTCFMSSRDLHTHCGYQVMMPESIAIICAPSKGDWGVFRLTDPPGMRSILNCTQTGLFHPHSESNVYTDALRPGHVYEARGLEFEIVDLRPPA